MYKEFEFYDENWRKSQARSFVYRSFKIVKKFTSSYEPELPTHMKIHPIFHVF